MTEMSWVIKKMEALDLARMIFSSPQNPFLDQNVQAGGGFVHDDQTRPQGQGHGDHGPLAHAAAELVGIAFHQFRLQADAFEKAFHPVPGFAFG